MLQFLLNQNVCENLAMSMFMGAGGFAEYSPVASADVNLVALPAAVLVFASITALGFRQEYVEYEKLARTSGQSGWTFARKVKLVVDSVTAFSAFPIRLCSLAGLAFLGVAVVIGGVAIWAAPAPGGGTRIVLAVIFGLTGVQMLALGLVGEYVWRSLDESRRRPVYLIEAATGQRVPTIE